MEELGKVGKNRPLLNALVETFKQRESFIDTEGK